MNKERRCLVTVVTPSLNCASFLRRNIESVRRQGLDSGRLEHWVIDGGSTDGTADILSSAKDVLYVSEKDLGLSDAVNKGLSRASGEWILWLNADDQLKAGAVTAVLEHAASNPDARIIVGDLEILRYDGSHECVVPGWAYDLAGLLGSRTGINQPATIVHRECFERVGLLDVTDRYAMDYEWMVRAVHHYSVSYLPVTLAAYQRRQGSITDAHLGRQFSRFLEIRRKYGMPRLSAAEFRIRWFLWTDFLRKRKSLRRAVRFLKRLFGAEPLHPA